MHIDSYNSFNHFIQDIKKLPLLSHEHEYELATNVREKNCGESAKKLVVHNLKQVVKISGSLSGYGFRQEDLIQEGTIGLIKAVRRFDPSLGHRFVTYATSWITAEMNDYVIKNWRVVKIATSKAQRKLFFRKGALSKADGWLSLEEKNTIAEDASVSLDEVESMSHKVLQGDIYIDTTDAYEDDDDMFLALPSDASVEDVVAHEEAEDFRSNTLKKGLSGLNEREQYIIQHRWLSEEKSTLKDLATIYQVSEERIRQIESNAIKKLKKALN